jgi:GDPmannose 4,6-dehydratase
MSDPDLMVFGQDEVYTKARKAFVTGITGQDGSYLTELLLSKGYEVHGLVRRNSVMVRERIDPIRAGNLGRNLILHYGDVTESGRLTQLISRIKPDEVYHLAAQSHVRVSFDQPDYTNAVVTGGALNVFSAVHSLEQNTGRRIKIFNAGSSEMFGFNSAPQNEATAFRPRTPYGVAKIAAHWHGIVHRESFGLFIANGILFNHESPRRGESFVTRKISRAVGRILAGTQKNIALGSLSAKRDWGFAGDYVNAMWLMLQQEIAEDFVIATGTEHSVEDFLTAAFGHVGLDWEPYLAFDAQMERPSEVNRSYGDAGKAHATLGWTPKCDFTTLVKMMVDHDVELARREVAGLYP